MPNGMPNLGDLLQSAQRMQQEMSRVQDELAKKTVDGSAGGGMVIARVNGKQQVLSVTIEKAIVDPDEIEMLQDLVVAAVNQALAKASEMAQDEMSKITGGMMLKVPGLF
ncbi:MAG: YbaB/EbfC family nucleoid-associated protein [Myxococcales bacterium]|nr:YbaB/EbfC family nucleoid-associated protein [Myxococcales bacterium]